MILIRNTLDQATTTWVRRRNRYGALRVVEKGDDQLEDEEVVEAGAAASAASGGRADHWHHSSTEDLQVNY
jgi:hypothetical protein